MSQAYIPILKKDIQHNDTQHNDTQHKDTQHDEHSAK
jgi:hypothetical protein